MMEPQKYKIATLADIAALDPRQQADCLKDVATWLEMRNATAGLPFVTMQDHFIWVDDSNSGRVSGVHVGLGENVAQVEGIDASAGQGAEYAQALDDLIKALAEDKGK